GSLIVQVLHTEFPFKVLLFSRYDDTVDECHRPDERGQQPHAVDPDRDTELQQRKRQIDRVSAEAIRARAYDRGGGLFARVQACRRPRRSQPSTRAALWQPPREAVPPAWPAFREGVAMAWRAESPPLRPAKSDTQGAGERVRDSQRPALRLGDHRSAVWSSWSSVLQPIRINVSTTRHLRRPSPQKISQYKQLQR